ncbi:universal stress protein [Streptomyces sp. NPDC001500]
MTLPLVTGIDGSEASLTAVDWAVDEAACHGLALRLVHASRWERYERAASHGHDRPAGRVLAENLVATERGHGQPPELAPTAVPSCRSALAHS